MIDLRNYEAWFITGSQHLYGEKTLKQVEKNSKEIVKGLSGSEKIPVKIVFKSVVTTPDSIYNVCLEANNSQKCVGLILWMHTFSPAKMWIEGLKTLNKPFVHLHTQFNRDIPWDSIDMDFMNLNQSAHGGREFGFIRHCENSKEEIVRMWSLRRLSIIGDFGRRCSFEDFCWWDCFGGGMECFAGSEFGENVEIEEFER